jgi:hypothetical protein
VSALKGGKELKVTWYLFLIVMQDLKGGKELKVTWYLFLWFLPPVEQKISSSLY